MVFFYLNFCFPIVFHSCYISQRTRSWILKNLCWHHMLLCFCSPSELVSRSVQSVSVSSLHIYGCGPSNSIRNSLVPLFLFAFIFLLSSVMELKAVYIHQVPRTSPFQTSIYTCLASIWWLNHKPSDSTIMNCSFFSFHLGF